MSKVEKKKKKKEWSILTEVHFWAAPLRIGHHKEPLNALQRPPPPPPPLRFQGIRCGSLKIDTPTLDTLKLVWLELNGGATFSDRTWSTWAEGKVLFLTPLKRKGMGYR